MEQFDLPKITEFFEAEGIHIIPAFMLGESASLIFMGDLAEFIASLKAIGARSVIMEKHSLVESDFLEEWDAEIYGEYDGVFDDGGTESRVYLPAFLPRLKEYKKYIGDIHYVRFLTIYQSQFLSYLHETPLYFELEKLKEEAVEKFENKEKLAKQKHETELNRRLEQDAKTRDVLLHNLRSLLDDTNFTRLSTQRAMQAYALERYPELVKLDSYDLKTEVQNLSDRVKARKLIA